MSGLVTRRYDLVSPNGFECVYPGAQMSQSFKDTISGLVAESADVQLSIAQEVRSPRSGSKNSSDDTFAPDRYYPSKFCSRRMCCSRYISYPDARPFSLYFCSISSHLTCWQHLQRAHSKGRLTNSVLWQESIIEARSLLQCVYCETGCLL